MPKCLDQLPPELVFLVFERCSSAQSLYSLISASPHCYRIFASNPVQVLSRLLIALVPSCLRREVAAASEAAQFLPTAAKDEESEDQVKTFLDRYFGGQDFTFPNSKTSLTEAFQLHRKVCFLAEELAAKAAREARMLNRAMKQGHRYHLPDLVECEAAKPHELNMLNSEETRLYRGFVRFELYCRVFQAGYRFGIGGISARDQFDVFIRHLSPWEVEEITSIHQHCMSIVGDTLYELEEVFQIDVKAFAISEADPKDHDRSWKEKPDPYDVVDLHDLDLGNLCMFSDDFAYEYARSLGTMAAAGLSHAFQLATGGKDERFHLIRMNFPSMRDFLPAALEFGPVQDTMAEQSAASPDDDDPAHASFGYCMHRRATDKKYSPILEPDSDYPVRMLGYAFWDAKRILSPTMCRALAVARHLSDEALCDRYLRSSEASLQSRLERLQLYRKDLETLEKKYGFFEENDY
ncbi:hypothetical protein K4F52_006574 [Lecanicillium sp. MT-2017a]|nr:hypothetical protein K4F52_006574 [Lecanicillium sp. MT-2017a]